MRRMLSKIGLSLLLAGGSLAVAPAANAVAGCVGTENLGLVCIEVDVTTSDGTYEDCVYVFSTTECTPISIPLPVPHVSYSCSGWVTYEDIRWYCVRN